MLTTNVIQVDHNLWSCLAT